MEGFTLGDGVESLGEGSLGNLLDTLNRLGRIVVVDDFVGAVLLNEIKVSGTGRGNDLESREFSQLNGEESDRGGSAVDEDPLGAIGLLRRVGQAETGVEDLGGGGEAYAVCWGFSKTDGAGGRDSPQEVALYSGVFWDGRLASSRVFRSLSRLLAKEPLSVNFPP